MNITPKNGLTDKFRPPATKVCRLCKDEKPISSFSQNIKNKDGYMHECRACMKGREDQKIQQRKENAKTFFDAKYFTLFLLLLSSSAFSQVDTIPPYCNTAGVTLITYRPDTVRAKLLVTYTTRRWGVAHARDGYVVTKAGEAIAFFTDKMECFPPETELWKWREANKKIIKTRHARN